jgi:triosephosphate isomerase (TIM)
MSARRPLVAGNWKLHKTVAESKALAAALVRELGASPRAEVVVAPVFTALAAVAQEIAGSPVALAAQDVYHQPFGAFTGEVSAPLLADVGCTFCIVGHSERRQIFGESDEAVHEKAAALLAQGLCPIVCVGETLEQREADQTLEVVRAQIAAVIEILADNAGDGVIAYEPVWAIGTGKTATPDDAQAVHAAIRAQLGERNDQLAAQTRILYGGSVKPQNAEGLLAQPDVDGALVGGASLDAAAFNKIIEIAARMTRQDAGESAEEAEEGGEGEGHGARDDSGAASEPADDAAPEEVAQAEETE